MRVRQLIEALKLFSEDTPIGVAVNGHCWFAPTDTGSHGPGQVRLVRLSYAGGKTEDIVVITHRIGMPYANGYEPATLQTISFEERWDGKK